MGAINKIPKRVAPKACTSGRNKLNVEVISTNFEANDK